MFADDTNLSYEHKNIKHFSTLMKNVLVQDGGRYHIETSPLICSANQWTGF